MHRTEKEERTGEVLFRTENRIKKKERRKEGKKEKRKKGKEEKEKVEDVRMKAWIDECAAVADKWVAWCAFCDDHLSLFIKQGPNLCTGAALSHGFLRSINHFLSLGDCRKLIVSTVRVSDTKTNLIDVVFFHGFPVLSDATDNDD